MIGTASNRDGIGARIVSGSFSEELRAGSSYLAQSELVMHLGLGSAAKVDGIELRWPSGAVETLPRLEARRLYVVKENRGILAELARRP